jgi:hypothetical protein
MTWKCLRDYLTNTKQTYAEYLRTDHWQDVRRRFWASRLHNGTCYVCGSRERRGGASGGGGPEDVRERRAVKALLRFHGFKVLKTEVLTEDNHARES